MIHTTDTLFTVSNRQRSTSFSFWYDLLYLRTIPALYTQFRVLSRDVRMICTLVYIRRKKKYHGMMLNTCNIMCIP